MASLTQWTWVWVGSRSWCWTGRPGVEQLMRSQRVRYDWTTELNWIDVWSAKDINDNLKIFEWLSLAKGQNQNHWRKISEKLSLVKCERVLSVQRKLSVCNLNCSMGTEFGENFFISFCFFFSWVHVPDVQWHTNSAFVHLLSHCRIYRLPLFPGQARWKPILYFH